MSCLREGYGVHERGGAGLSSSVVEYLSRKIANALTFKGQRLCIAPSVLPYVDGALVEAMTGDAAARVHHFLQTDAPDDAS